MINASTALQRFRVLCRHSVAHRPLLRRTKSKLFMRSHPPTATIGRSTGKKNLNRLSQNVDAVIDVQRPQESDEEPDFLPPLLERTLRRCGLSDSSIHSTFANQGDRLYSHLRHRKERALTQLMPDLLQLLQGCLRGLIVLRCFRH